MNHYYETVSKFLDAITVDITKDVEYRGKCFGNELCVCGQKITKGYVFKNIKNNKRCVVGKNCLRYVADYLSWNSY